MIRSYNINDKAEDYALGPTICHKRKEIMECLEIDSEYGFKISKVVGTGKFELQKCDISEVIK